jgi:hypothetical protein
LTPTRSLIAGFLLPYLEAEELVEGVSSTEASTFLARMVLSYMEAPGRWNLDDPVEVSQLVTQELLAGIVLRT